MKKMKQTSKETDSPSFLSLQELASDVVGGKIVFATDEWFASANNMLNSADPVFIEGKFTPFGKWMDGWESRRKRTEGHDWSIIELGMKGEIKGVTLDTRFFTGNYALRFSVQAARLTGELADVANDLARSRSRRECEGVAATESQMKMSERLRSDTWTEIVSFREAGAGYEETRYTYAPVDRKYVNEVFTHVRLNIYPDGGVARFRVHGQVVPVWPSDKSLEVDLAAAANGGTVAAFSDAHYGQASNLIAPGRARTMGEGWETARKPDRPPIIRPSAQQTQWKDWVVLKLGSRGIVHRILIDTNHFKGNFPESCLIEGADHPTDVNDASSWVPILRRTRMQPHCERNFSLKGMRPITHVRVTIYPDGGISRVRLFGRRL